MNINRIPIVRSIMARRKACKEEEAAKRLREGYLKQGSKGPKKKVDVMGAARIKKIQARKEKKAERLFVEGGGAERGAPKEKHPVIYYHGQLNTETKFTNETRSQKKRRRKKERNEAALRKGESKRKENDWLFRL